MGPRSSLTSQTGYSRWVLSPHSPAGQSAAGGSSVLTHQLDRLQQVGPQSSLTSLTCCSRWVLSPHSSAGQAAAGGSSVLTHQRDRLHQVGPRSSLTSRTGCSRWVLSPHSPARQAAAGGSSVLTHQLDRLQQVGPQSSLTSQTGCSRWVLSPPSISTDYYYQKIGVNNNNLKLLSKLIRNLRITFCYTQLCSRCLVNITPVVNVVIHCVFALSTKYISDYYNL